MQFCICIDLFSLHLFVLHLFVFEDPTSNNSFKFLINFSLVFKITLKLGVRPIPFQHKLQVLVSHFFWREMCDVICNLPILGNISETFPESTKLVFTRGKLLVFVQYCY